MFKADVHLASPERGFVGVGECDAGLVLGAEADKAIAARLGTRQLSGPGLPNGDFDGDDGAVLFEGCSEFLVAY